MKKVLTYNWDGTEKFIHSGQWREYNTLQKIPKNLDRSARGIYQKYKDKSKRGSHYLDMVPYTVDDTLLSIFSRMEPGMTYENYSTVWEIDHILAVKLYSTIYKKHGMSCYDIILDCFNPKNLRACFCKDNIVKTYTVYEFLCAKYGLIDEMNKLFAMSGEKRIGKLF